MNQRWQEEAMRLGGPALVQVLAELRDGQLDLMANMDLLNAKTAQLEFSTGRLLSGFPANDIDGHRCYHESVIEWRELRNRMVREALMKIAGAGTLAAIGWLLMAIWQSFKVTVTR